MVKWLLAAHPAISATLAALPNLHRTPPHELSHEEWGLLSSLLLVLEPLRKITKHISGQQYPHGATYNP